LLLRLSALRPLIYADRDFPDFFSPDPILLPAAVIKREWRSRARARLKLIDIPRWTNDLKARRRSITARGVFETPKRSKDDRAREEGGDRSIT
jgi:hypothetical protein